MAKDTAEKMKGEDLKHAYDAVRVANKSVSSILGPKHSRSYEVMRNCGNCLMWFQVFRDAAVVSESTMGGRDICPQN